MLYDVFVVLQASRKAEFNLGSSLSSDLTGFSLAGDVTVSLGFKSTEQGLLLQNKEAVSANLHPSWTFILKFHVVVSDI